jgi:hypothetical protein
MTMVSCMRHLHTSELLSMTAADRIPILAKVSVRKAYLTGNPYLHAFDISCIEKAIEMSKDTVDMH